MFLDISGYTSSAWLRRTKTPTLPCRISARGPCIFIGYTCIRTECALFAKCRMPTQLLHCNERGRWLPETELFLLRYVRMGRCLLTSFPLCSPIHCIRSIRWQYPVRFELLLKALPQPDLYGATPQAQDLSDLQVRVYDYQRKLIRSREVGPDAVLRDGKWTAVKVYLYRVNFTISRNDLFCPISLLYPCLLFRCYSSWPGIVFRMGQIYY